VYVCVYINIMGPLSTTLLSVTGIFTIINSNKHNFNIKAMIFFRECFNVIQVCCYDFAYFCVLYVSVQCSSKIQVLWKPYHMTF